MRWAIGLAFFLFGLSGVANAQVEPSQIAGAWVCDQAGDSGRFGVEMEFEHKLAFSADGTFTHGMVGIARGEVSGSGPRSVTVRTFVNGTWKVDGYYEKGSLLLFNNTEAKVTDLLLNGYSVDPGPYQQAFIVEMVGERGGWASVVDDQLMLDYGGPMLCSRQALADEN
ncbi:MAG: hypothetical protein RIR33_817 [Pseudomonadota bacterium]|jgi:hypothetical protein